MASDTFASLLNRAVERELAFQAAKASGVELTAEQRRRLEEIRARNEKVEPGVIDSLGRTTANTEFELRDFTGLMLQASLAEKAGVPSPHVTSEQVEAYFQEHKNEYAEVPADSAKRSLEAWQRIEAEIRMKLAPALQAAHDEQMKKFVQSLKTNARIVFAHGS